VLRYLDETMRLTSATEGSAKVEEAPPLSERAWHQAMRQLQSEYTAYRETLGTSAQYIGRAENE